MNEIVQNELIKILGLSKIKIKEPLSLHTTFRIGGPADILVIPENEEEITKVVVLCEKESIPYYVIGNGSNILVGDLGYRGVIILIDKQFSDIEYKNINGEHLIYAKSGVMLSKLASVISEKELTGFEFAAGIPGTLGGAVTMNAGAYGGEIKDSIVFADVVDKAGKKIRLSKEELELGYRTSRIQKDDLIVIGAEFKLQKGNKKEILDRMEELAKLRKEKQPLEYKSAGSTFKRPEGYFAGKLIMDSGLREYRVGDIMISKKHCGFVINVGDGTAKEVRTLMENVDRIVYDKFQVHLEPEIKFLGEFSE